MATGFIIKGSAVRGTKKLIFKTRAEAQKFIRKVGGTAVPMVRKTPYRRRTDKKITVKRDIRKSPLIARKKALIRKDPLNLRILRKKL